MDLNLDRHGQIKIKINIVASATAMQMTGRKQKKKIHLIIIPFLKRFEVVVFGCLLCPFQSVFINEASSLKCDIFLLTFINLSNFKLLSTDKREREKKTTEPN